MKKTILFLLSLMIVAALGTGVSQAEEKATMAASDLEVAPSSWTTVLSSTIKSADVSDLVVSISAECALATESTLLNMTGSTSNAHIDVRVLVDGVEAVPGAIIFADRTQTISGNLANEDAWLDIYLQTRNANAFNFIDSNVGTGVHTVEMQVKTSTSGTLADLSNLLALVGKRTMVVESVRLNY